MNSSLTYQDFDFSFTVTGTHGKDMLDLGYEDFYNLDGVFNVGVEAIDRWRSPEDPGGGRAPRAISTVIHRHSMTPWVLDASNIWIRNIALGYSLPTGVIDSFGAQQVRVYTSVKNAWISNTNFQNPEAEQFPGNPLRIGQNRNLNHPISRVFTIGINITM